MRRRNAKEPSRALRPNFPTPRMDIWTRSLLGAALVKYGNQDPSVGVSHTHTYTKLSERQMG